MMQRSASDMYYGSSVHWHEERKCDAC